MSHRGLLGKIGCLAAILLLPGCLALPPAVTLASFGIDIGSFALTGKTASDHVLSAVADGDCRLMGVLEGEICREEQQFEAALEVLRPLPEAGLAEAAPQLTGFLSDANLPRGAPTLEAVRLDARLGAAVFLGQAGAGLGTGQGTYF